MVIGIMIASYVSMKKLFPFTENQNKLMKVL